jgi:glyoxylase-like metal-dependent hydrolase (beta-lactamase superfamily II)
MNFRRKFKAATLAIVSLILAAPLLASEEISDQYPASVLYSKPVEVIPHVFSAIGATGPPTYENSGHNNNLSFIVTGEGVVVFNAGAAAVLAEALHDEIKIITDQPVVLVINENGQGHAMLGNSYWNALGVPILSHVDAAHEVAENGDFILQGMQRYNLDKAEGTTVVAATITFEDKYQIDLGDFHMEVLRLGPAHGPGDIQLSLPEQRLMISGDIAFHERLLPIFDDTCTSCWLETWDKFEALAPLFIVPGHGHPTNLAQLRRYTFDYLTYLREKIGEHIDNGGELGEAYYVDQAKYAHLDTFEQLATRNAGRVFAEMEWE